MRNGPRGLVPALAAALLSILAGIADARPLVGWDKKINKPSRFKLVLDGTAAVDKETGLVWDRSPSTTQLSWTSAFSACLSLLKGDRRGFRVPSVDELQSLIDGTQSSPALPAGHPFTDVQAGATDVYWTSTTQAGEVTRAYAIGFGAPEAFAVPNKVSTSPRVWCVRGPGHDRVD